MIKSFTLISLTIMLSFSILGPSLLVLLETETDIEIVQDVEEEKKETKKELEEYQKFYNNLPYFTIKIINTDDLSAYYYLVSPYGHIKDINSPPPDYN